MSVSRYAIGVDFRTESGRAVLVDISDGRRLAVRDVVYEPLAENVAVYDVLHREYVRLHDYFGRGENDVMKTLRQLRAQASASQPVAMEA